MSDTDCLPFGSVVNEVPSSMIQEKVKMKHDTPFVTPNPTTSQPSKDISKDLENNDEPSASVDSQIQISEARSEIEKEAAFYQKLANEVLEDEEDLFDAENMASKAAYPKWAKRSLEEEKGRLQVRSRQAMLHVSYTEQRVKNLGIEIKRLRQIVEKLPEDFEPANSLKHPVYLHELRRSTIREFQLNEESKTIPLYLQPALEVLMDDRHPLNGTASDDPKGYHAPERLRIRSRMLAKHLERLTGQRLEPDSGYGISEKTPSSIVLLRPFKLFVTFERSIRASVQDLEDQIEKKAAETADSKRPSQQSKDSNSKPSKYDDKDLLIDLKLLIEFFDIDLKTTFELRSKVSNGTATAVEYQDLWHLFKLGEEVIHQSSRLGVYRVINFTVRILYHTPFNATSRIEYIC